MIPLKGVPISFGSYGNYQSGGYGAHCIRISVGNMVFYYSYDTIVAFRTLKTGLVCTENVWGPTTGKHLNWIQPNKNKRLPQEKFDELFNEIFNQNKTEEIGNTIRSITI